MGKVTGLVTQYWENNETVVPVVTIKQVLPVSASGGKVDATDVKARIWLCTAR